MIEQTFCSTLFAPLVEMRYIVAFFQFLDTYGFKMGYLRKSKVYSRTCLQKIDKQFLKSALLSYILRYGHQWVFFSRGDRQLEQIKKINFCDKNNYILN